jgi:hypothetical protein
VIEITDTVALMAGDDSIPYRDELHHVKGE